ncbi:MAG: HAMP domain-containing histidine kinase [Actinomycetota bacterium]|nr:HAMP domain-containing histidine kinase [Actinomycetota bacterium]
MTLSLRARFALLAGALVLAVASLAALGGYLAMRASLLDQAARTADSEARQIAALVQNSSQGTAERAAGVGGSANQGQGNQVDINDPALTHELAIPGTLIEVRDRNGALVQASSPGRSRAASLPSAFLTRCLRAGRSQTRIDQPPLAVACERVGSSSRPVGLISVGAPLADALASLKTLRTVLLLGVLGGALISAVLALLVARRALRPVRRIAETAETIRSGDLTGRIGYRGHDELGRLAAVLDECFAELETALERQRRFSADASHELRTPLAAIRANIELLRDWADRDPAARRSAIASVDQASRRASRLVEDLLYLARLEQEPPEARAPVALDDLVLGVVREAGQLRPEVSIHITHLDEPTVDGDELRLQQLLLNLLDNALRVSAPPGHVAVGLTVEGRVASVAISDQGPGIEPDELARIFDRLYSRPQLSGERAGSGLGLSIARSIARDHGGELTARNNDDRGATFTVTLPLARDRPRSSVQRSSSPADALPR